MSFLRHGEIYPWDEGTIPRPCPRPSQWMSFQPVIPGGLLSAEPASASPADATLRLHPPQCQRNFIERYFVPVLVVSAQGSTPARWLSACSCSCSSSSEAACI